MVINDVSSKSNSASALRPAMYAGFQSRIAKSLGIDRSAVSRVMRGQRTSKRVSAAIEKEIARIERLIAREKGRAA